MPKPLLEAKGLYVHDLKPNLLRQKGAGSDNASANFQLADDVQSELNELHSKGIDVNQLLREMLKRRREEIAEAKEKIAKAQSCGSASSRYIPVEIRKILKAEFGEKCSIPNCRKPAATIHHTQRFGLSQNHDPRFLAPLCHEHHAIAHTIDSKYHCFANSS